MSSRGLWLLSIATLFVTVMPTNRAHAYCRMTTKGGAQIAGAPCLELGEPLAWTNACLSYAIDQRASASMSYAEVEAAVDLAFETWENADCGDGPPNVIFKPLDPSTCKRAEYNCSGNVNTIAFLDPWEDTCAGSDDPGYDRNAFAVTIVWHNTTTGEILDADMMINDTQSSRFNAGGPYMNCPETGCEGDFADLGSIVTHEIGHFIGIGHSDVEDATMFPSAERDSVTKRTLAQDDIDAVCDIYPPGSLTQSCNAAPKGGLALNCEVDADGRAIACSDGACTTSAGNGCSASGSPSDAPWGPVLAALLGLTVWQRRRRAARS